MSQTLIDALDALESQVTALSNAVKAADPAAIAHQAEIGAHRGAINATADFPGTVRDLGLAVTDLRRWAMPAVQMAQEAEARQRWWKLALIALALVLSLLGGSLIGIGLSNAMGFLPAASRIELAIRIGIRPRSKPTASGKGTI